MLSATDNENPQAICEPTTSKDSDMLQHCNPHTHCIREENEESQSDQLSDSEELPSNGLRTCLSCPCNNTEPPVDSCAWHCSHAQAFAHNIVSTMSWTDNVHRVSGAFLAIAHQMLLRCWISGYAKNTILIDIAANFFASSAMFLLNTVDSKVVVSTKLHKTSMIFLFICFVFMFSPLIWALWKLNKQNPDTEGCAATEVVASMIVIIVAMSVRFTELMFRQLWQPPTNSSEIDLCGVKVAIALSITSALAVLAGLTLQAFCMLETESESNYCAIVPLSYLLPLPLLFITSAGVAANPKNTTWQMWSKFVPAYAYVSTAIWPFVLHNTGYLTTQQLKLSFFASALIVFGARLLIGALPMDSSYENVSSSQAGFYMF